MFRNEIHDVEVVWERLWEVYQPDLTLVISHFHQNLSPAELI